MKMELFSISTLVLLAFLILAVLVLLRSFRLPTSFQQRQQERLALRKQFIEAKEQGRESQSAETVETSSERKQPDKDGSR